MQLEVESRRSARIAVASWPAWAACGVFLALIAAMVVIAVRRDGSFAYPLDDAYIHLRLGQNLRHGVLGLNPGEFASASSSPIWPVLIAGATFVAGSSVGIPLALDLIVGVIVLFGVDRWARHRGLSLIERLAVLGAFLLLVPLPVVALTGMEHVLQIGAYFLLVSLVVERLEPVDLVAGPAPRRLGVDLADLYIALAAALSAATRFEVVFVLLPLGVLVVLARRWSTLVAMALGAVAPVAVVVAVNLGQGWPALPSSVIAKSMALDADHGLLRQLLPPIDRMVLQVRLIPVLVVVVVLWWHGRRLLGDTWPARATRWNVVAVSVLVLHSTYVVAGGRLRYDAYVVALAIGACAMSAHSIIVGAPAGAPPARFVRAVVAVFIGLALLGRAELFVIESVSMQEIHDQQVQMAAFSAAACDGCVIVANDIGALGMYSNGWVLDDFGLANREVLEAKRDDRYDTDVLDSLARDRGASLAMVYDTPYWLPGGVPDRWEPLGTWTIETQVMVGGRTVSLYSLDPSRTAELQRAFCDHRPPSRVVVQPASPC